LKSAIVTGCSSGIGLSCAKKLLSMDYKVIGISKTVDDKTIKEKNFTPYICDLSNMKELEKLEKEIGKTEIHTLVNAAGVGYFAPHEELSLKKIEKMIFLNLSSVLILTKIFLRTLKKNGGYIFNISSICAKEPAVFGAAYAASKAGVSHFSASLFKEARKSSLKVINIAPDITDTAFFDDLHFKPTSDPLSYIDPNDIADIIKHVLTSREGTVMTDITLQPQLFKLQKIKRH